MSHDKLVDVYPTYGYLDGDSWVVPVKLYVYEHRKYLEEIIPSILEKMRILTPGERDVFQSRIRTFLADSESREIVEFAFDRDPENETFTLRDSEGHPLRTNLNGIKKGEIRISNECAIALLDAQESEDQWLTFKAISNGHRGRGRIRLIHPKGLSVITDIDDTIKITEMTAGSGVVVRNAFFKEFAAAPGMAALFEQWRGNPVHYVSGTLRQFFRPLVEFLWSDHTGFPKGTVHLRDVRKNLFSGDTWSDLEDIITADNVTYNHKLTQISAIMHHFPEREYIFVGDSGQYDPGRVKEIGSIQKSGNRLRINVQLINTDNGFQLWSDTFESHSSDLFEVQGEITRAIITAIEGQISEDIYRSDSVIPTQNMEVYELYLKGKYFFNQLQMPLAINYFEEAIKRDTQFARAYAALAEAYSIPALYSELSSVDMREKGIEAAHSALRIDPLLADAHSALGWLRMVGLEWETAEKSLNQGLELDPNSPRVRLYY
ncbi:hypothetical protein BH23BAC3_BH23BAC3_14130 [soil metagenome]